MKYLKLTIYSLSFLYICTGWVGYAHAANDFSSDPNAKALWRFENGALTADSKGTNTLTDYNTVGTETTNFKEGTASADFELNNSEGLYITDANLNAGFPLKNGDTNKNISISMWIRIESFPTSDDWIQLFNKLGLASGSDTTNSFQIRLKSDYGANAKKLYLVLGYNGGASEEYEIHDTPLAINTWYHITATYQNSDKAYAVRIRNADFSTFGTDKTGTATLDANKLWASTGQVSIGHVYWDGGYYQHFDGLIDELAVFSDVLTETESTQIARGTYSGAAEFTAVVDPGNGSGTDYTSLSVWENGVNSDLTSTATQVFSGTKTGTLSDGATVYLCRGSTYQTQTATVAHAGSGQIMLRSISGSVTEQADDFWNSSSTCTGAANYFTISNGGNSVIAVAKCRTSNGAADTTQVEIYGWTASATNYIKIWTDPAESYRHHGVWDDSKYRLQVVSYSGYVLLIRNYEDYVKIDGLQLKVQTSYADVNRVVFSTSTSGLEISNSLVDGVNSYATNGFDTTGSSKIYNNIIYNCSNYGLVGDGGTSYFYNNTLYGNSRGIYVWSGSVIAKNNIVKGSGNTDAYIGTFASGTDYNATDGTDTSDGGAHSRISQTFSFIDATNKDFHLAFSDAGAKGYGVNLMNDPYLAFQNDIDGQERTGNWSIGADEPREAEVNSSQLSVHSITDGLVMYQSFDGNAMDWSATSAEALDATANNNDGDVVGATPVRGRKGQALNFNGTTGNVDVGTGASLNITAQPLTISAWIKPNSFGENSRGRIFDRDPAGAGYWFMVRNVSVSNTLAFSADGGGTRADAAANAITIGVWQHVAMVYSSNTVFFYVNGTLNASPAYSGVFTNYPSAHGFIGNETTDISTFDGSLDEVRVYNRALSPDEVGDLYRLGEMEINTSQTDNMKSGLVGMWSFDGPDISGANAYDRSGYGNTGTISGAVPARGKKGQALSFNGSGDYIDAGNQSSLQLTGSHTLSAWVKADAINDDDIIVKSSDYWGYLMNVNVVDLGTNRFACLVSSNGSDIAIRYSGTIPQISNWYHVACDYNASNQTLDVYVNGVLDNGTLSGSVPASVNNPAGNLKIGRRNTGYDFDGLIDEVRVYNRALSPDEVGDLYRMGTAEISR